VCDMHERMWGTHAFQPVIVASPDNQNNQLSCHLKCRVVGHSMGGMCEVVRNGSVTVDFFLPSLFFLLSLRYALLQLQLKVILPFCFNFNCNPHFFCLLFQLKFGLHFFVCYFCFYITFLIEFVFKFHPSSYYFSLFLCQIWFLFFIFILFFALVLF
jgi:hypothetical protein